MKLQRKGGIPGCWGKSGVYYPEGTPEEHIRAAEEHFAECDRRHIREVIIYAVTMTTLWLIVAVAVVGLLLL